MNFDAGVEVFRGEVLGVCPMCGERVGLDVARSWRPDKTGFTVPHGACLGVNYEVKIERAELPTTVAFALSDRVPQGPNPGLLVARALRTTRVAEMRMKRFMQTRPPRVS